MHINLHKTFSTPHGGGGPGAGPVVLSAALAPFAPVPFVRARRRRLPSSSSTPRGRRRRSRSAACTAFHGQMGMFVRALAYMLAHGADGMRQASEDAVLNANYIRAGLARPDDRSPSATGPACTRCCSTTPCSKDTGVTTLDFAKAMIDEGYHPMTMYFPLVVHGAMLIEPTESESKASLDLFIATLRDLVMRGQARRGRALPRRRRTLAPRRRLDETRAARQPKLRWEPPEPYERGGGVDAAPRLHCTVSSVRSPGLMLALAVSSLPSFLRTLMR